jgi:hypothetical protein
LKRRQREEVKLGREKREERKSSQVRNLELAAVVAVESTCEPSNPFIIPIIIPIALRWVRLRAEYNGASFAVCKSNHGLLENYWIKPPNVSKHLQVTMHTFVMVNIIWHVLLQQALKGPIYEFLLCGLLTFTDDYVEQIKKVSCGVLTLDMSLLIEDIQKVIKANRKSLSNSLRKTPVN